MGEGKEGLDGAMERLLESVRASPVMDRSGYQYFIHPLTDGIPSIGPDLLRDASECMGPLLPPAEDYDLLLTAEAMGIPLASSIMGSVGRPLSIVRKRTYGLKGEVTVGQRTGYSTGRLSFNLPGTGGRLVIIDDVLSTGGTLRALGQGAREAGWEVILAVVLFDKYTGDRDMLQRDLGFKVRTLIKVDVVNGSCSARPTMD
ncbi:MAG: adenine phosphoribosyltransferase [Candidatus Thermoplasmatota archaeon]|jgi:adenine phosphoribosyltransferase|nr:adenine phosphoribosyltransferase [Candidatus Thermoplasmatota archaeon]